MAPTQKIVRLSDYRTGGTDQGAAEQRVEQSRATVVDSSESPWVRGSDSEVSMASTSEKLFADSEHLSADVKNAIRLLKESQVLLESALSEFDEQNFLPADDYLQRFYMILPELYCCRSVGEGFANIIQCCFHGLKNLEGMPPSRDQAQVLNLSIRSLLDELFMDFDESIRFVDDLEEVGFNVGPSRLTFIGEIVDSLLNEDDIDSFTDSHGG